MMTDAPARFAEPRVWLWHWDRYVDYPAYAGGYGGWRIKVAADARSVSVRIHRFGAFTGLAPEVDSRRGIFCIAESWPHFHFRHAIV
jgi:hypothetical protein